MKILVTGGTGFIGHYLANELQVRGHEVTVLDKAVNNLDFLNNSIKIILGDICTINLKDNYDYVYHLAALRSVSDSFLYPEDYITTNILGTFKLLKAFPKSRFVFTSSSTAEASKSIYGITKRTAEELVAFHSNSISIRLMNIFGERQIDTQMAFPAFCNALKHNTQAIIYGDGTIIRDYTYVKDVVNEIIALGESNVNTVIDIGYGKPITILELYKMITRCFNKEENYIFSKIRKGDMLYTCAKNVIVNPKYGLENGIRRTVEWWKE